MKPSDVKPLKEALSEYYQQRPLSSPQLKALLELQEMHASAQRAEAVATAIDRPENNRLGYHWQSGFKGMFFNSHRLSVLFSAVTAALVSIVILTLYLSNELTALDIMEEIAYNHNQNMAVEIRSSSIDDIDTFLSSLSFTLIKSNHLAGKSLTLLGGRYCAIDGKLAAQLKFEDGTGNKTYTVYQVARPTHFDSIEQQPITNYVNGVKVILWQENGLLLGIASNE